MTAGPTREALDPARYLSNPSTGRMGFALAAEAVERGADVTLIAGPTHLAPPEGVHLVRVSSADEMFRASLNQAQGADLILKAAAVADYRPEERSRAKLKKDVLRRQASGGEAGDRAITLRLLPTPDILEEIGRRKKPAQVLVGFAAETGDLRANAAKKLKKKNIDLIIANRIGSSGEGFESETNRAIVIERGGRSTELPLMSKREMSRMILDLSEKILKARGGGRRAS